MICTIYDPATSTSTQVNAGYVVGPAGQDGHGMSIINTTTLTGTLSASDLAKANGTDDCILIYTDNGADLTMQRIMRDSSNVYFYSHFVDTGKAVCSICEVNAVTGAYTISGGDLPIKASNIDSDTATNGQVLTADGSGGASWQNAGGGTPRYELDVVTWYIGPGASGNPIISCNFHFIQDFSSVTNSWSSVGAQLSNNGYNVSGVYAQGSGYWYEDNTLYLIIGVRKAGAEIRFLCLSSTALQTEKAFNGANLTYSTKTNVTIL